MALAFDSQEIDGRRWAEVSSSQMILLKVGKQRLPEPSV